MVMTDAVYINTVWLKRLVKLELIPELSITFILFFFFFFLNTAEPHLQRFWSSIVVGRKEVLHGVSG